MIMACQLGYAQFPNILVSKQFEPKGLSIAFNPKNTKEVVAGAGFAGAFYSRDGGYSWHKDSVICEEFNLFGNPVVLWDTAQKAYFSDCAYQNPQIVTDGSWVDRILVNRSEDSGKSFHFCEDFGKNAKHIQMRHSICVDPKTNKLHAVWTDFEKFESADVKDSSCIKYCRSSDGGKTWSDAKTISYFAGNCRNKDSTLLSANICCGPNGELYVCWAGPQGLVFQCSTDGGNTWLQKEIIVLPFKYGWQYTIGENYAANGLPTIGCDVSKTSAHKGRIYICWGDAKNGKNNKDVFITYSDDKGEYWTEPTLVTYYPNHKDQFMPRMQVDAKTGAVYILYYNKQNAFHNSFTDVYLAISRDGAKKFDHYKLNQLPFTLLKKDYYGDYTGLCVYNNEARAIWLQRMGKKELNVYTTIINDSILKRYVTAEKPEIELAKTFTYGNDIPVSFKSDRKLEVSASLTKPLDASFEKEVFKNKSFKAGTNSFSIKPSGLGLTKGAYILTLYYNGKTSYTWITE